MVFNSFSFLIVYPVLFLLYYFIPSRWCWIRNLYLLIISYLLYAVSNPRFLLILIGLTAVTYLSALLISKNKINRKLIVILGGAISFMPLLIFKDTNFVANNIEGLLSSIGISCNIPGLNWAIPLGISFFTFQAVGYLFDVYYDRIEVEKNYLDYSLFVSFFPSIVSGPINKASLLLPQIKNNTKSFDYDNVVNGLKMLLWGMIMKVVIADRISIFVDTVYSTVDYYTGLTYLVASFLYSIQIYADFAGYTLMALGVGKTLGFELTENFRRPYFAVSVTDFWRRWHISLSTWLKDYVYIPLGGSRCSKLRNYWNIFVTFLVSGIWHGANWTFIIWGICHGLFQIIEKALGQQKCEYGWMGKSIKIFITFMLVNFAWIFFRMPSVQDAFTVISEIVTVKGGLSIYFAGFKPLLFILLGVIMLLFKDITDEFYPGRFLLYNNKNTIVRWLSYIVSVVIVLTCGVLDSGQFIYANF